MNMIEKKNRLIQAGKKGGLTSAQFKSLRATLAFFKRAYNDLDKIYKKETGRYYRG